MNIRMLALTFLGAALTNFTLAAPASAKRIALVFDDGPRPADAEPLLALLAEEKIAVTFALVGDRVNENPATAKAIAAAGHEIVNHSQTHAQPRDLDDRELAKEVAEAQRAITQAVGAAPRWYWPPYLAVDDRVREAAKKAGISVYAPKHLVSSQDWDKSVSAEEIFRRATTDVRDGTVILFHEWRLETRQQLPAILADLRKQGCVFFNFSALEAELARKP